MGRVVGIDLGTTYSLIAYLDKETGQPRCIPGPYGETLCPSVVSVDAGGSVVVGEPARRRLLTQPDRTIYSVKRLMGRGVADVQDELKIFPFRIDPESQQVIRVRLGDRLFTPPEISAFILRELKSWAEEFFGDKVDRAVITVPAYFNDAQRQATKDAGRLAGLVVLRLVNEPTAAALAYGLHEKRRGYVAVYDLGGGTFDISILKLISTGEGDIYQVLSTNGDTHLGGDDIDNLLQSFARTMGPVKSALADAKLKPGEMDEVVLVGGSTRIPLVQRTVEEYFGRRPHVELNPDEVVALGAAVQANILETGVKDMLLLDVTPLSLGIETMGGVAAKIIPRNSTIPASAQELFTTGVDNQTGIDIHVLQGERELAKDCRSLARFQLKVPPGPAGLARIEVKFLIDANGILQVAARDLHSGEERSVEVQPSYGLSDAEIEGMLEESIEYAEQDFTERQLIEARNEGETILRATEKSLAQAAEDLSVGLDPAERRAIEAAVAALRQAMAGGDYKLIRARIDDLNQATVALAE